ncbi:MAG: hypothetical protein JSR80_00650 [Verrucomicrobia bacterium]|nr:hypothetical protein [Verrucomicrobiota bacterium]
MFKITIDRYNKIISSYQERTTLTKSILNSEWNMDVTKYIENKLDYREIAKVTNDAPRNFYPSILVLVLGMIKIKHAETAEKYGCKIGEWIYEVEYPEGLIQKIPERYLEKDDSYPNKFTYGDSIVISKNAPPSFHPGEFASVCGLDRHVSKESFQKSGCPFGDWWYIVEFLDISSIELPECYLEKEESLCSNTYI